jgi:hypothetical protein
MCVQEVGSTGVNCLASSGYNQVADSSKHSAKFLDT